MNHTDADPLHVEAGAEKRFFVEMLTRDIELIPAIVDLVDNSVDGARRIHGSGDLHGQWIKITLSGDEFSISDNSGGISINVARNYAFRFGRALNFEGVENSVGQFGVGMKRAIFKIGNRFEVESTYKGAETNTDSHFTLRVDVPEWALQEDWSFRLEDDFTDGATLPDDTEGGTQLTITSLHRSVASDLNDRAFESDLKSRLSELHQGAISKGLTITVNGQPLTATLPVLQYSTQFSPINEAWTIAEGTPDQVTVRLYAGTVRPSRDEPTEDQQLDEDEPRDFQDSSAAGWYIFGNDRLLLRAERTNLTGWGRPGATYHPQYRNFRGYVYLDAKNAGALPWNTAKTAIDQDSRVWREVANRMKVALVAVQGILNGEKDVRAQHRRAVALADERGDQPPVQPVFLTAIESAPAVPLADVPRSTVFVSPVRPPRASRGGPPANFRRIQYAVDLDVFEAVSASIGAVTGSEVGRRTFDYYFEAEVE